MIVGSRIKEARQSLGYTQAQLGDLVGVSKVAICDYEIGTRTPILRVIIKLSEVLNLDINYMLGMDINAIAEDSDIAVKVRREDLKLLSELKKNNKLYNNLVNDPERMIKLINKKIYR